MRLRKRKSSGIVDITSRSAGVCIGTTMSTSKKILRFVTRANSARVKEVEKQVTVPKSRVVRPQRNLAQGRADEKNEEQPKSAAPLNAIQKDKESQISQLENAQNGDNGGREWKGAIEARIRSLHSELVDAQRDLAKAPDEAKESQSRLALQLNAIQTEKESLFSDLAEAQRTLANAHETKEVWSKFATQLGAILKQAKLMKQIRIEEDSARKPPVKAKVEVFPEATAGRPSDEADEMEAADDEALAPLPTPPKVTAADVQNASFPSATATCRFSMALTDLADGNDSSRASAAESLGHIPGDLSVKVLVAQLLRESSPRVREKCVDSLTALGMKEGLQAVESALKDPSAPVRLAAVRGVYRLAAEDGAASLARMFSDVNEDVRRRAVDYAGWLGNKSLAASLLLPLNDGSASVRLAAAEATKNIRSRQVVSALIDHLSDPDKEVREAVLSAIEAITGESKSQGMPATEAGQARLVQRWREWWRNECRLQ